MEKVDCIWCAEKSCGNTDSAVYRYNCKSCGIYGIDRVLDVQYRKCTEKQKDLVAQYLAKTKSERNRDNEITDKEEWKKRCSSIQGKIDDILRASND